MFQVCEDRHEAWNSKARLSAKKWVGGRRGFRRCPLGTTRYETLLVLYDYLYLMLLITV